MSSAFDGVLIMLSQNQEQILAERDDEDEEGTGLAVRAHRILYPTSAKASFIVPPTPLSTQKRSDLRLY